MRGEVEGTSNKSAPWKPGGKEEEKCIETEREGLAGSPPSSLPPLLLVSVETICPSKKRRKKKAAYKKRIVYNTQQQQQYTGERMEREGETDKVKGKEEVCVCACVDALLDIYFFFLPVQNGLPSIFKRRSLCFYVCVRLSGCGSCSFYTLTHLEHTQHQQQCPRAFLLPSFLFFSQYTASLTF